MNLPSLGYQGSVEGAFSARQKTHFHLVVTCSSLAPSRLLRWQRRTCYTSSPCDMRQIAGRRGETGRGNWAHTHRQESQSVTENKFSQECLECRERK